MRRVLLLVTVITLSVPAFGVEPSENAGRRGTYQCTTGNATYKYYVCVPKSYADDNPAGLHLFFHGQGVPRGPGFGAWSKHFLEPFNLIGINMHYTDGDNSRDTEGKVAAAVEAIQQTIADYKIIRGRGVVCSFSGGGLPHALLASKYAKRPVKRGAWPFNHSAPYGSNYRTNVWGLATMSWFLGLGEKEWNLAGAGLGRSQTKCTEELYREAVKGRCPDVYLKITKGKGHSISEGDRVDSAKGFRRSDLAFCAFLYADGFAEKELQPIVKRANDLELGRAAKAVETLLKNPKLDAALRKKAERVRDRIASRSEAVIKLSAELVENDVVLANYYGKRFEKQLKGHPREAELKKILAPVRKKERSTRAMLTPFASVTKFFTDAGRLQPGVASGLKKVRSKAGENSLLGKMATEFLALQ